MLLGGASLLVGCSGDPEPALPSGSATGGAGGPLSTSQPSQPPAPPLYAAPPGTELIEFKEAAGRFAQAVATADLGEPFVPPVGYAGGAGELSEAATRLRPPGLWARSEAEFVQYGGLTPVSVDAASGVAIVVLRQILTSPEGGSSTVRRTLDLRLHRDGGSWQVASLASVGGDLVEPPAQLSAAAREVVSHERIDLTDTSRWDIYSGQVSAPLLATLLQLAKVARLDVTVLKTGHPRTVVDGRAAPPVSAHFLGNAVDINSLDGIPIAQSAPAIVRAVVAAANNSAVVDQVGVPTGFDLDGRGRRTFSNLVHADHLHVAVRGAGP